MKTFLMSDIGKVRQHNEDCAGVFSNERGDVFAIVADGVGGHRAGDVASKMTVDFFEKAWSEANLQTPREVEQWLTERVQTINKEIYHHAQQNLEECEGMGTTLVVAILTESFITIGHIGDSRCYMLANNRLNQLTEDHTLVNELIRFGQISKEDAEMHPRKNIILRALGTEKKVAFDVKTFEYDVPVILLLCSDGLSDKVSADTMQEILEQNVSIEEKGESLVQLANDRGGEDNITVILIHYAISEKESG